MVIKQTAKQIFFRFLKFGFLAWGGPVAQIAMIRKELVDEEKWISREQFNRVLAVYQALPGPEAHELCVYFGMKARGRLGAILAGLGFMLPGFFLMLMLTWIYVRFGIKSPVINVLFSGIQAAVIALITFAAYRIGKHAVVNKKLLVISLVTAVAFFAGVNFFLLLLIAGLSYLWWQKKKIIFVLTLALIVSGITAYTINKKGFRLGPTESAKVIEKLKRKDSEGLVFLTGLKGGLLTFGGAYTAIPFIQQDAVIKYGWMTGSIFGWHCSFRYSSRSPDYFLHFCGLLRRRLAGRDINYYWNISSCILFYTDRV